MSNEGADRQRQRVQEFILLLPLTVVIAGLSRAEQNRPFTEGQLEARSTTLRTAYRLALLLYPEVTKLMQLLPLASEIAGLAPCDLGKHFNEGQLQLRANTLKTAFKTAHSLVLFVARDAAAGL